LPSLFLITDAVEKKIFSATTNESRPLSLFLESPHVSFPFEPIPFSIQGRDRLISSRLSNCLKRRRAHAPSLGLSPPSFLPCALRCIMRLYLFSGRRRPGNDRPVRCTVSASLAAEGFSLPARNGTTRSSPLFPSAPRLCPKQSVITH